MQPQKQFQKFTKTKQFAHQLNKTKTILTKQKFNFYLNFLKDFEEWNNYYSFFFKILKLKKNLYLTNL
jgi:hypothetical protein